MVTPLIKASSIVVHSALPVLFCLLINLHSSITLHFNPPSGSTRIFKVLAELVVAERENSMMMNPNSMITVKDI